MLEDYKEILGAIAGIITTAQMFSGVLLCKEIYQAGSTKGSSSMPFVGGFVISILFLQHGLLLKDATLGGVNFIGIAINVCFLFFFYLWSDKEARALIFKQLGYGIAFISVMLLYVQIENEDAVVNRFGILVSGLLFLLVANPLFSIGEIVRSKNSAMIPLPMVLSGSATSISWMLYGLAAHQDFIVYQNLIMLSLSVPQLVLCALYPRKIKAA